MWLGSIKNKNSCNQYFWEVAFLSFYILTLFSRIFTRFKVKCICLNLVLTIYSSIINNLNVSVAPFENPNWAFDQRLIRFVVIQRLDWKKKVVNLRKKYAFQVHFTLNGHIVAYKVFYTTVICWIYLLVLSMMHKLEKVQIASLRSFSES